MKHRLVILGGGESGVGAALLAKQKGYEVFVSDESSLKEIYRNELQDAGIEFEEDRHTDQKILNADEVMKSPGIPEKSGMIRKIRANKIEIISEIELAYRFKDNSKIIGITGSNGKNDNNCIDTSYLQNSRIGLCIGWQYRVFICKTSSDRSQITVYSGDQQFPVG